PNQRREKRTKGNREIPEIREIGLSATLSLVVCPTALGLFLVLTNPLLLSILPTSLCPLSLTQRPTLMAPGRNWSKPALNPSCTCAFLLSMPKSIGPKRPSSLTRNSST